ncbi:MAG: cupin domain-containing protein [Desulfobulbaceae bacterium]|nr:cupin domain-containing protein [Desulfobulbaceae bacterium]
MRCKNIFSDIPDKIPEEIFENILQNDSFILERIVSKNHATPAGEWYDQKKDEWVILLQGAAGLLIEGEKNPVTLKPGDHILLPAHLKHRVEWTAADEETIWLALLF